MCDRRIQYHLNVFIRTIQKDGQYFLDTLIPYKSKISWKEIIPWSIFFRAGKALILFVPGRPPPRGLLPVLGLVSDLKLPISESITSKNSWKKEHRFFLIINILGRIPYTIVKNTRDFWFTIIKFDVFHPIEEVFQCPNVSNYESQTVSRN